MQKLKSRLKILAIICLSTSCQIRTLGVNQYLYDFENNVCYQRDYKFSRGYIGKTSDFNEVELVECNKIIGYKPDDYIQVYEWQNEVRRSLPTRQK